MVGVPQSKKERKESLVVIDDESDFYYNDDDWEGCCEDPIELYEDELFKEEADHEDND